MSEYAGKIAVGVVSAVIIGAVIIAGFYYLPQPNKSTTSGTTLGGGTNTVVGGTTTIVGTITGSGTTQTSNNTSEQPISFVQGSVGICPSNCLYPSPYLSAEVLINSTSPLRSLRLYINNTYESTSTYTNNFTPAYIIEYKANPTNQSLPIISGRAYAVQLFATFQDSSTSSTFAILVIEAASSGTLSSQVCQNLPSLAQRNADSNPQSQTAVFTIIEADSGPFMGMNGSALAFQSTEVQTSNGTYATSSSNSASPVYAPVITVYLGQVVTVHVFNCASNETHGFSIVHYLESSSNSTLVIYPNQSASVSFTANVTGNFTIFEPIFSAIHPFMQSGLLIVLNNPNGTSDQISQDPGSTSLCATNCGLYPSPFLTATLLINSTTPLNSLQLYINGTLEATTQYSNNFTNYYLQYKSNLINSTVPIVSGDTYAIQFVGTFNDNNAVKTTSVIVAS